MITHNFISVYEGIDTFRPIRIQSAAALGCKDNGAAGSCGTGCACRINAGGEKKDVLMFDPLDTGPSVT